MRRLPFTSGHRALAGLFVAVGVALAAASPVLAGSDEVHATATLRVYGNESPARAKLDVTYDTSGRTDLDFRVSGLAANTPYVVRAHVGPCTTTRSEIGPVFQASPNPNPDAPSDPEYINDSNEIWLDVETDPTGNGVSHTDQPWQPSPVWRPASVVVHQTLVQPHPYAPRVGKAIACLDVPF